MSQIANNIRYAIRTRLADVTTGFNSILAGVAAGYGITQPEKFFLDFGPDLKGFVEGNLTPDDLENSSPAHYPFGFLYAVETRNENLRKFNTFSGRVTFSFDYWLSWRNEKALRDFENFGDCVEDVVVSIMNTTDFLEWGSIATYNGDVTLTRGKIEMQGEHWRQLLAFQFVFEYDVS